MNSVLMHVASLTPAPSERNVYEAYATVALSTCVMTHHVTGPILSMPSICRCTNE